MNERKVAPTAYSHRIIAFIDVLGFGALVDSTANNASGSQAETLKRIGDAILWSLEELGDNDSPLNDVVFTQFSDSFVLSCDASKGRQTLLSFTLAIFEIIDCFLGSGLLLRGGITRGELIHDGTLLFGPAMNQAYHLESKVAKVPRIILDPDLAHGELTAFERVLARDDDQLLFINYFKPWKVWFVIPGYRLCLQQIIEAMPRSEKLREKRAWITRKYNDSLEGFSFDDFKKRMLDYVDDGDANNAVVEDYPEILEKARKIRKLEF